LQNTHQLPPTLKDACTGNLPLRILSWKQAINHQLLSAKALVSQMSNPHFGLQLCICSNCLHNKIQSDSPSLYIPVSLMVSGELHFRQAFSENVSSIKEETSP
jgi:hypothetical protein